MSDLECDIWLRDRLLTEMEGTTDGLLDSGHLAFLARSDVLADRRGFAATSHESSARRM